MKYESIFIISPDLPETDIDEILKKIEELIANNGGKVHEVERWGKKRLAYPVKKHKYGYYVLIQVEAPANLVNPLERFYRLSENIIKFLTTKVSEFKSQTDTTSSPEKSAKDAAKTPQDSKDASKDNKLEETATSNKPEEANKGD